MIRRLAPVLAVLVCSAGVIACDDDSASDGVASGSVGGSLDFKGTDLIFSRVFQNSPAARAGIRPGDKVLKINGNATGTMTMDAAKTAFRGPIGGTVDVLVETGAGAPRDVKLTREVLKTRVPIGPTPPVLAVPAAGTPPAAVGTVPAAVPSPAAAPAAPATPTKTAK